MADKGINDDQAVGHTVRLALSNPKVWALIVGVSGYGWMQKGSADQNRLLRKISADVAETKLKVSAIIDTTPDPQKQRIKDRIELQLAALRTMREGQP